jgi:hypothetical protein
MRTTAMISALLLSCSLAACVSDDGVDQGPEDDPLSDGKDDSYYSPTDHGTIPFNEAQLATITDARRYHRWSFELTGDADLVLDTRIGTAFGPQLDTVLYLYEDGVAGYLEKNDDAGPGWKYSEIRRRLGPGTYHVIVKGKYATARGPISIAAGCDGRGCFGEDWLQALKDQYDASGTDDLTDISFSRLPTAVKAAVRDFEAEFDDEQYADFFSWDAGDAGTAYLAEVYDEATLGVQIYDRAGTVMATGYATESSALEWSDDGEAPPTVTLDGVTFTAAQAAGALRAANEAPSAALGAVGITGSPRTIILDGRTWASLAAVAGTSGIGAATMERLRTLGDVF